MRNNEDDFLETYPKVGAPECHIGRLEDSFSIISNLIVFEGLKKTPPYFLMVFMELTISEFNYCYR